jgi:hypothetical protein
MALHRDIFWIGRQWAVTGFGLQAIDQRLKGAFDIEALRLWADDLAERMQAHAWLNAADFDKALSIARTRFPEPPRRALPLVDSVLELIQPVSAEPARPSVPPSQTDPPPSEPVRTETPTETSGDSSRDTLMDAPTVVPSDAMPTEAAALPALQASGRLAHFLPQWRIRH